MAILDINKIIDQFVYTASTKLTDVDFYDKPAEFDDNPNNVVTSEATYFFSCPGVLNTAPVWIDNLETLLCPIGKIAQVNLNETQQVIPYDEIGSKIKCSIVGSTQYQMNLSRKLQSTNNLKYALYKWLFRAAAIGGIGGTDTSTVFNSTSNTNTKYDGINFGLAPGVDYETFFAGMESDLYNLVTGLLIVEGTANGEIVSVDYCERAKILTYNTGVRAGDPTIMENASLSINRVIPFVKSGNGSILTSSVSLRGATETFKFNRSNIVEQLTAE